MTERAIICRSDTATRLGNFRKLCSIHGNGIHGDGITWSRPPLHGGVVDVDEIVGGGDNGCTLSVFVDDQMPDPIVVMSDVDAVVMSEIGRTGYDFRSVRPDVVRPFEIVRDLDRVPVASRFCTVPPRRVLVGHSSGHGMLPHGRSVPHGAAEQQGDEDAGAGGSYHRLGTVERLGRFGLARLTRTCNKNAELLNHGINKPHIKISALNRLESLNLFKNWYSVRADNVKFVYIICFDKPKKRVEYE